MKTLIMYRQKRAERTTCNSRAILSGGGQRGAALIIALSVLLVLLSLAITFALMVRYESEMTQQTFQAARGENLLDGVLAKAMYRLNRDLAAHPDALSLDHGWRTWFSGAAFVGKNWTREQQGNKSGVGLYFQEQGLVSVNLHPVEEALDYTVYVRFLNDNHIEPLFRGPRTEHWIHVPRGQGNAILLYAEPGEVELVRITNAPAVEKVYTDIDPKIDLINPALNAAGRSEFFNFFSSDDIRSDPTSYPFVTPAFYDPAAGYAPEIVNNWADLDNTGDGNRDSIWMPVARDLDRGGPPYTLPDIEQAGDFIDNDLDGIADPMRNVSGEWVPLFESAPFVYHGMGTPKLNDEPPPDIKMTGDGRDNDGNGIVDDEIIDTNNPLLGRYFLTVPLPGMVMQVDLNSDGVFDERDHYCDGAGSCGPVYARLPDTILCNIITGFDALGNPIIFPIPLTSNDVDVIDNDFDLMVNNYRTYAYVGPHNRLGAAYDPYYINNQIPSSRAIDPVTGVPTFIYTGWHHFEDPTVSGLPEWALADRNDPLFASAYNRGYHDINVDAVFGGVGNVQIFFVDQSGTAASVSVELENILRAPNALHITCSGEPVSEIVGRAAVHITDEAGKVNLNNAGGHVLDKLNIGTGNPAEVKRALNQGVSPFEYETRLLPDLDETLALRLWSMRTGAAEGDYNIFNVVSPLANYDKDISLPGYGLVDDNGNALLLSMSGRDDTGLGLIDGGLRLPRLSPNSDTISELALYFSNPQNYLNPEPANLSLGQYEIKHWKDAYERLGIFEGIDEPAELRLFNPLRNLLAESAGANYGELGDRLLLRKKEIENVNGIGDYIGEYLHNLVTTNSDTRNTFATQGHGMKRTFLKIDPNYANPQQLAATLLISGSASNIVEKVFQLGTNTMNPWATNLFSVNPVLYNEVSSFSEGLRQFDNSLTGNLFGQIPSDPYVGAKFPADPILQTMRMAVDIVSARDRSAARHKLITENLIRNPETYADYLGLATPVLLNTPFEQPNERERILDGELLPVGDIQEYLQDALGITPADKRLLSTDWWWKNMTGGVLDGEDRVFQYAAASSDAIKINELMVRPVRRVEAESLSFPLQRAVWWDPMVGWPGAPANYVTTLQNLDPAYYPGMLTFDVETPAPYIVNSLLQDPMGNDVPAWQMRSTYDMPGTPQPLLGENTAWVYDPAAGAGLMGAGFSNSWVPVNTEIINPDIIEFRFRESAALPAGRYYLSVNVDDQYGNMSVVDAGIPDASGSPTPDTAIMEYSVKYIDATNPTTITQDIQDLLALLPMVPGVEDEYVKLINSLFQQVDEAEYIASPAAQNLGSACPPGWVFLPADDFSDEALEDIYSFVTKGFCYWIHNTLVNVGCNPGLPFFTTVQALGVAFTDTNNPDLCAQELYDALNTGTISFFALWTFIISTVNDPSLDACYLGAAAPIPSYLDWRAHIQIITNLFSTGSLRYFPDEVVDEFLPGFPPPTTGQRTYTVIVPPATQGELCVAFRVKPESVSDLRNWQTWYANTWPITPDPAAWIHPPYPAEQYPSWLNWLINVWPLNPDPTLWQEPPYNIPGLAINFFDFSQEPSHEYIELANTSDEEVDVGGWTLEVGIPDPPGATHDPYIKDPFKSEWRIPDNTRIAPQGKLLLGFNVFDGFRGAQKATGLAGPIVGNSGIGLAAFRFPDGTADDIATDGDYNGLRYVTEPPTSLPTPAWPLGWYPDAAFYNPAGPADYSDATGSVFRRDAIPPFLPMDFIDNDGDGLSSAIHVLDNAAHDLDMDTDHVLDEYRSHGVGDTIPAWSRVVQLVNEQLWMDGDTAVYPYPLSANPYVFDQNLVTLAEINSPEMLARLVLRGGVLPNYPEHDGIDNDGDGGYVTIDKMGRQVVNPPGALLTYVRGTLDKDMVDNTMDGRIDNCGVEMYYTGGPYFDPNLFATHGQPLLSEGVDEGRMGTSVHYPNPNSILPYPDNLIASAFRGVLLNAPMRPRMYGPGSYERGAMPVRFWSKPLEYYDPTDLNPTPNSWVEHLQQHSYPYWSPDGSIPSSPVYGFPYWPDPVTGAYYYSNSVIENIVVPATNYATDSPEWLAFVERRWNPGDNVIVTLYVGSSNNNRVADQVTYREYDVTNRTIDDIQPSPYFIDGFTNYLVNASRTPEWQGGTGAIDPVADFVGLNWESPSFWLPDQMGLDFYRSLERKHPLYHGDRFGLANRWTPTSGAYDDWAESLSVFEAVETRAGTTTGSAVERRFDPLVTDDPDLRLFSHAFWASPLRMNTHARIWENPFDLAVLAAVEPAIPINLADVQHPYYPYVGNRQGRQFSGSDRVFAPNLFSTPGEGYDSLAGEHTRFNTDFALHRARTPEGLFSTPGALATLPRLEFNTHLHAGTFEIDYGAGPTGEDLTTYLRLPRSIVNMRYLPEPLLVGDEYLPGDGLWSDVDTRRPWWRQDPTLLSATLVQTAAGGPLPPAQMRTFGEPEALIKDALDVVAMNPIVLTVGQARVVPLWPGPGAYDPVSGTPMDEATLRNQFKWHGMGMGIRPSHMWTPVYLFDLPDQASPGDPEKPWLVADYPAEIGQLVYSLDNGDSPATPLITPAYLFNGRFITDKLFGTVNAAQLAGSVVPRWPVRGHASVVALNNDPYGIGDPLSPSDRAVMYVSRHNNDLGDANRAEAVFVWDNESGLENGTYVAYVGTFIPGLARRVIETQQMVESTYSNPLTDSSEPPLPHSIYDTGSGAWLGMPLPGAVQPVSPIAYKLLGLDPDLARDAGDPRFEPELVLEFITDRRYVEQMQPPPPPWGPGKTDLPGMLHPRDWYPDDYMAPKYKAGDDGYILYSADPNVQWRAIPVRVTDNYLALRVRNMGDGSRIACITHVVLAPAPRNRGQININTAETQRIVRGALSNTEWEVDLFNSLMGLPGIVNVLDLSSPLPNNTLALPSVTYSKNPVDPTYVADPWLAPWPTPLEMTAAGLPPTTNALPYALIGQNVFNPPTPAWEPAEEGRAALRLAALLADNRTVHPTGRYYTSLAELLGGVYVGGVHKLDRDGPWPLSNLGKTPETAATIDDVAHPTAVRFEEILQRFGRVSNMITTRSDVFEIIATVQSGSVIDDNNDGVLDYRGDEFFPNSETRARIVYDRRAPTIRIDEAREVGQEN